MYHILRGRDPYIEDPHPTVLISPVGGSDDHRSAYNLDWCGDVGGMDASEDFESGFQDRGR